jgi:hypothetical protein
MHDGRSPQVVGGQALSKIAVISYFGRALVLKTRGGTSRPNAPFGDGSRRHTTLGDGAPLLQEEYPSMATIAGNALKAVGRVAMAAAKGEPIRVSAEVLEQRRGICRACPYHDAARDRCRKCGCSGIKLTLATESCPDVPPRWSAVT